MTKTFTDGGVATPAEHVRAPSLFTWHPLYAFRPPLSLPALHRLLVTPRSMRHGGASLLCDGGFPAIKHTRSLPETHL